MNQNRSFLTGTLSTIVLALLKDNGEMYGYEICQKTRELTNEGIQLTEGAIYPTLHKLEKNGLIISKKMKVNGRTRKYYLINVSSKVEVDQQIHLLSRFTIHLKAILNPA